MSRIGRLVTGLLVTVMFVAFSTVVVAQGNGNGNNGQGQGNGGGGGIEAARAGGGGCEPECGGDTVAPEIELVNPGSFVNIQYPLIEIGYCDNGTMNTNTRWIKVNGVTKTSSFLFQHGTSGSMECFQTKGKDRTTSVALNYGTNSIQVHMCDYSNNCTTQTFYVTRGGASPTVTLVDTYDNQSYSMCAANCFAVTHAQSTIPYFSLDAPRSVSLVYNGDRVDPKPYIHADVSIVATGGYPSEYWLEAKIDGMTITFLNGESKLRFANPTTVSQYRIGGQFNAASYTTGVYDLEVTVTALHSQGPTATVKNTKLIILNENNSDIARGWTLGLPRVYPNGNDVVLAEGDGSATYFYKTCGGCGYVRPAGDFSTLETRAGGGWTRWYADSSRVNFRSDGQIDDAVDRVGNTTSYLYTPPGELFRIHDPLQNHIDLFYGVNGLNYITDDAGRVTDVTVNGGNLTQIKDPDNLATNFTYVSNQLTAVQDRNGATTTINYDGGSGKISNVVATAVPIYGAGTVSPTTSFSSWHRVGVPTGSTSTPFPLTLSSAVTGSVTDPLDNVTSFTVNGFGQPLVTTAPLSQITSVLYTPDGLPYRITKPDGGVDQVGYNSDGLLTWSTPAANPRTDIAYQAFAQVDSVWSAGRPAVSYQIDPANGNVTSSSIGGGDSTVTTYDNYGRPNYVVDPDGHMLSKTVYNGVNNNRSWDSLSTGGSTVYKYDAYGRRDSVLLAGRPWQRTEYDILNRVRKTWDGFNALPTVYHYSAMTLDSVTDPANQTYRYSYNALGWGDGFTDPTGNSTSSHFDRNGRQVRWINRRGQSIYYSYDDLGRIKTKTGSVEALTFTYSANGRQVTGASPMVTETTYLNLRGQPDSVRTFPSEGGTTLRQIYGYDPEGRLDTVGITSSAFGVSFQTRSFGYNASTGTLDSLGFGTALTRLFHRADGTVYSKVLPTGAPILTDVVQSHGVTRKYSTAGFNSTTGRRMSTDSLGNIVFQSDDDGADAYKYIYDDLNRLEEVRTVTPGECYDDYELGWVCESSNWTTIATSDYDSVGNRFVTPSDDYALGNRIREFDGCTYGNDLDGNVSSRTCGTNVTTFEYLADNKLRKVIHNGNTFWFWYDAAGRLIRRGGWGGTKRYYWLGGNLLAQFNVNATTKDAEYSYYGMDNLHAMRVGSTNYYAHTDVAGNVIALSDPSNVIKRTYEYDEWGKLIGGVDNANFNGKDVVRFKGAMWDPVSGLYHMRARFYAPESGRFLSEDPIGLAGGINPYTFAGNNPVTLSDPTGLRQCNPGEVGVHSEGRSEIWIDGELYMSGDYYHRCGSATEALANGDPFANYDFWECIGRGANEETCRGLDGYASEEAESCGNLWAVAGYGAVLDVASTFTGLVAWRIAGAAGRASAWSARAYFAGKAVSSVEAAARTAATGRYAAAFYGGLGEVATFAGQTVDIAVLGASYETGNQYGFPERLGRVLPYSGTFFAITDAYSCSVGN